jgi:SHS2 domain-containing protein
MHKFVISDRFTTADIGLDLEADSREELFTAGAEGMFGIIFEKKPSGQISIHRQINLQAATPEELLVDWLSELLYLFDTDGLIADEIDIRLLDEGKGFELRSEVGFKRFNRKNDPAEHEVKAVTYYRLKIIEDDGLYRCHVVFDL